MPNHTRVHKPPIQSLSPHEYKSLFFVDRGVFRHVPIFAAKRFRVYDACFVDSARNVGTTRAFTKSMFVVMLFNNKKYGLLTGAHTAQCSSQHLLLSLFGTQADFVLVTWDIAQAYTKAELTIWTARIRPSPVCQL